jgi:thiol-disulfide isomerase/thioredoxin
LLAQEVASRHPGRVRFVEENFGESPLAERFGVEQYPAIFVDEALVAGPWDFFEWPGTPKGRYTPFRESANRERFFADLSGFVERRLQGEAIESSAGPGPSRFQIEALPGFEAATLEGRSISSDSLRNQVVLVEFWATWCPPCRSTLSFLGELSKRHEGRLEVIPIAVSSPEPEVRSLVAEVEGAPGNVVLGSDDLAARFGGVLAVPTLMVFDRGGATAGVFYGAPPDLHQRVEELLARLYSGKR